MQKSKLLLILLIIISVGVVGAVLYDYYYIDNNGSVKTIGCKVYEDRALTTLATSMDWGIIEPGDVETKVVYVKLDGNTPTKLLLYTDNFNPPEAQAYISVTWNVTGAYHPAGSVVPAEITLDLSSSVTEIIDFSFRTVIEASD